MFNLRIWFVWWVLLRVNFVAKLSSYDTSQIRGLVKKTMRVPTTKPLTTVACKPYPLSEHLDGTALCTEHHVTLTYHAIIGIIKIITNGKYVTLNIMTVLKVSLSTAGVKGCAGT